MLATPEPKTCRAVRAGGMTITLRNTRKELYIPCTMTSNNSEWERVVLPPQRRRRPPRLLRQGAHGQGRLLAPRGFPAVAPDTTGVSPGRIEGPSGHQLDRGVRPRGPLSPADRPPDGEATPHLRDARGRGPRRAGAVAAAAGPLPAGVRGHPGATCHRSPVRPERRRDTLGVHHAPRRPVGKWTFTSPCSADSRGVSTSCDFACTFADKGCERHAVRPAHASVSCAHTRGATARAGAGGAQEGAEHAAAGAPGAEELGVLAARAAGALLSWDRGILVVR
jgi:hypothetical protein